SSRKGFNPIRTHSVVLGQRRVPIYFSRGRVVQRVDGRSSARLHIHPRHEADARHYYRRGTVQSPLREMRPDDPSWSRFDIGHVFVPLRGPMSKWLRVCRLNGVAGGGVLPVPPPSAPSLPFFFPPFFLPPPP